MTQGEILERRKTAFAMLAQASEMEAQRCYQVKVAVHLMNPVGQWLHPVRQKRSAKLFRLAGTNRNPRLVAGEGGWVGRLREASEEERGIEAALCQSVN